MKIYILCVSYIYVEIMNFRIPLVVASEQGSAQTNFYNWGCKVIASGASFVWSVSSVRKTSAEGEHLDKVWLIESLWKEEPQRVIVPYLKKHLRSLLLFLSTVGHDNLAGSRPNYRPRLNNQYHR